MKKSLLTLTSAAGIAIVLSAVTANAQDIYVTDSTSDQLTVILPNGTTQTISNPITGTYLDTPTGIAVDTDASSSYFGDVFVANSLNDKISIYDPTTGLFSNFASGLSNPQGLAFDSDGNLYVANDVSAGTITEYAVSGNTLAAGTTYATGLNDHYSIATTTTAGQLYVTVGATSAKAGTGFKEVLSFGVGGYSPTFKGTAPTGPKGVTIGPDGNLWVVYNTSLKVGSDSLGGPSSVVLSGLANGNPNDLVFGPDNTLYITDFGTNLVAEYTYGIDTSTGKYTFTYDGSISTLSGENTKSGPDFLAYDSATLPVPEPGTYALLLGGLVVLYVMQRRRTAVLVKS